MAGKSAECIILINIKYKTFQENDKKPKAY